MTRIDVALLFLALTNLVAFSVFALDKRRARSRDRRIPEATLLLCVVVGGLGAWIGQHVLRHKTWKEPFRSWMGLLLFLHVVGVVGSLYLLLP